MAEIDIEFHPDARQEYLDALQWYVGRSEHVARRFQQDIVRGVEMIAEGPLQWPSLEDSMRFIRLRQFPYILYYETLSDSRIQILAVAHSRRRPGYWLHRRDA